MAATEPLIFDAIRTPRGKGKVNGSLHTTKPVDLVVGLMHEMLSRNPDFDPNRIDDVVLGCVSPIGDTHPSTTSSMRLGSKSGLRLSISCIKPTTRSTGLVVCSEPLTFPLPRGVRMASNMSGSVAAMVNSSGYLHTLFGKASPLNPVSYTHLRA